MGDWAIDGRRWTIAGPDLRRLATATPCPTTTTRKPRRSKRRCPNQTSEVYKRQPAVLPQPLENLGGLNDGAQTRPPRFLNANPCPTTTARKPRRSKRHCPNHTSATSQRHTTPNHT